jgi:hypothetical protein
MQGTNANGKSKKRNTPDEQSDSDTVHPTQPPPPKRRKTGNHDLGPTAPFPAIATSPSLGEDSGDDALGDPYEQ